MKQKKKRQKFDLMGIGNSLSELLYKDDLAEICFYVIKLGT